MLLLVALIRRKLVSDSWSWLCGLVDYQLDGSIAPQGFRIGASLMCILHKALNLGAIDSRELSMKFNCQAVAGLVILDQAHQCSHRGILERGATGAAVSLNNFAPLRNLRGTMWL